MNPYVRVKNLDKNKSEDNLFFIKRIINKKNIKQLEFSIKKLNIHNIFTS